MPTWSILGDDLVNSFSLYTIDDIVANPRYKMSIGIDMNIALSSS